MAPRRKAGPTELVLFERWMDTTRWLFERTSRMPKSVRHSLTQRLEERALSILEDITIAAYRKTPTPTLMRASERLDRLKVLVRLAHELGHLSHGHYEESARRLSEAGRMLGGWLRTIAGAGDE